MALRVSVKLKKLFNGISVLLYLLLFTFYYIHILLFDLLSCIFYSLIFFFSSIVILIEVVSHRRLCFDQIEALRLTHVRYAYRATK